MKLATLVPLAAVAFLAACQGTRNLADPVLEIRGADATELGVATDYGLVFLGRTVRSGPMEVTAWFGDGPSVEQAVAEPLGGGLFTAEPDIRFPRVPLSFVTPAPGDKLTLIGRVGRNLWRAEVTVRRDAQVDGLLVTIPSEMTSKDGQVGAGLYIADAQDEHLMRLVGLVSGRVDLNSADGSARSYLTVIGPDQLWRLVTYKRDHTHKRKFVFREDIL